MLTLYDFAAAPSPRRARMFLTEKGIPFETVQVDLRSGEHMKEAYRAINPRCTVPALKTDDGQVICENAGIAAYAEALQPEPPLLGATPGEKAEVAQWNWRMEIEGLMAVAEMLRNSSPGMKDRALTGSRSVAQIPELAERGQQRLQWFFEDLNERLGEAEYVAGNNYSVADITATVTVDFAGWVKIRPAEDQTALKAWHARVKERASYTA